jgi:hypothetical protein
MGTRISTKFRAKSPDSRQTQWPFRAAFRKVSLLKTRDDEFDVTRTNKILLIQMLITKILNRIPDAGFRITKRGPIPRLQTATAMQGVSSLNILQVAPPRGRKVLRQLYR